MHPSGMSSIFNKPSKELLDLRKITDAKGIKLMCWYPLEYGDKTLMAQSIFTKLAQKYHKSTAQIVLKWHTQMGVVVIHGARIEEHIRQNIDLFNFDPAILLTFQLM